jgi:GTP cyclohydrolase I
MAGEKPTPIFRTEADLARLPASDRIRYRLVGAQCRYHANDNIAGFIETASSTSCRPRSRRRCRACCARS